MFESKVEKTVEELFEELKGKTEEKCRYGLWDYAIKMCCDGQDPWGTISEVITRIRDEVYPEFLQEKWHCTPAAKKLAEATNELLMVMANYKAYTFKEAPLSKLVEELRKSPAYGMGWLLKAKFNRPEWAGPIAEFIEEAYSKRLEAEAASRLVDEMPVEECTYNPFVDALEGFEAQAPNPAESDKVVCQIESEQTEAAFSQKIFLANYGEFMTFLDAVHVLKEKGIAWEDLVRYMPQIEAVGQALSALPS